MVGAIRQSFKYLDILNFRCHLEYAVPSWIPSQEKLIERLECVQRRATAMISETKGLTYKESLHKIDIPSMRYRRFRVLEIIETLKSLHNEYDLNICPKLILKKVSSNSLTLSSSVPQ